MNDAFEKRLAEQHLRAVPAEWRAGILREESSATARRPASVEPSTGWRSWLWPHPKAWAAMAACWLVLLTVNALTLPRPSAAAAHADASTLAKALAAKARALRLFDMALQADSPGPASPEPMPGARGGIRGEEGPRPC